MANIFKIQFRLIGGENTYATFGSASTLNEATKKIDKYFQADVPTQIINTLTGETYAYVR